MYTLLTEASFAYAWSRMQNDNTSSYDNYSAIMFFGGTPPTTQEDIALELRKSPVALAENAIAFGTMYGQMQDVVPNQTEFNYVADMNYIPVQGVKYFPELDRYVYNPKVQTLSRTAEGIDKMTEQAQNAYDTTYFQYQYQEYGTEIRMYELLDLYNMSSFHYSESRLGKENYSKSLDTGRYAYRYPLEFKFGEEVPIDSMWVMNGSASSSYTSNTLIVERWDSVNGLWVDVETFDGTHVINGQNNMMLLDFASPFTASKVRLTLSDTGSADPYLRFIHFCSKVDPVVQQAPRDITWAAILYTGSNSSGTDITDYTDLLHNHVNTIYDNTRNKGYPMLYLDVGEPGSNAAVIVNKANQVTPFTNINVLSLNLKITGGLE